MWPVALASVTAGTGSLIVFRLLLKAGLTSEVGNAKNRLLRPSYCAEVAVRGMSVAKRKELGMNRHRRPRPKPHTPFTKRAFSIPTDTALPPNGSPSMGKSMNNHVTAGGDAAHSLAA